MSTSSNPPRPFARPTFPALQSSSSASSSSYSSSSSSLESPSPASAPLPSPSSTQAQPHRGFFGSLNQQQQQQQASQVHQQNEQAHHPSAYTYQPNREGAGRTAAETNNYLSQAALLAEAAKRAQIAVVMRDIEGMEL